MKVAVCGGGASGIMAALIAAKNGADVTVFEMNPSPLKKLLATGNGRCNFTNRTLSKIDSDTSKDNINLLNGYYHSASLKSPGELMYKIFRNFSYNDTLSFFKGMGVLYKNREDYLYPLSDQALSIREALLYEAYSLGVNIINNSVVTKLSPSADGYTVRYIKTDPKNKAFSKICDEDFDRVILSTGSPAGLSAESGNNILKYVNEITDGLKLPFTSFEAALTRLVCKSGLNRAAGVRADCQASCFFDDEFIDSERGELQLTRDGLSGIMIFQLSSKIVRALKSGKKVIISLDFCPDYEKNELIKYIRHKKSEYPKMKAAMSFNSVINQKLLEVLLEESSIELTSRLENFDEKFVDLLKAYKVSITGAPKLMEAQVASGGISLKLLNDNLMLKQYPGVFVTGELLDIDGKCGGFNLQAAWSTGAIAGRAAAMS